MRLVTHFLIYCMLFVSCAKEIQTQFSEDVLNEQYISLEGELVSLQNILSEHKGKQIVIDIWASWCKDCIVGLPELRTLQAERPEAIYLFLSADRNFETWKRTIKKYNIEGDHYFMQNGTKGLLGKFADIDWIPRYMIVDSNGYIELFEAIEADDPLIRQTLE